MLWVTAESRTLLFPGAHSFSMYTPAEVAVNVNTQIRKYVYDPTCTGTFPLSGGALDGLQLGPFLFFLPPSTPWDWEQNMLVCE